MLVFIFFYLSIDIQVGFKIYCQFKNKEFYLLWKEKNPRWNVSPVIMQGEVAW